MKKASSKNYKYTRGAGVISSTSTHFKKILILILFLLIVVNIPITSLDASNYKTGKHLKAWGVKKGDIFEIEYIHSVELTPVSEIYFIDEDYNIVLDETYFYSYGAGLPATTPYQFEITENNEFRIYNIKEIMNDVIYRTGAVRADHHIKIKNKSYSFLTFSRAAEGVKFTVKRASLLKRLLNNK